MSYLGFLEYATGCLLPFLSATPQPPTAPSSAKTGKGPVFSPGSTPSSLCCWDAGGLCSFPSKQMAPRPAHTALAPSAAQCCCRALAHTLMLLLTLAQECLLGWGLRKEAGCRATPPLRSVVPRQASFVLLGCSPGPLFQEPCFGSGGGQSHPTGQVQGPSLCQPGSVLSRCPMPWVPGIQFLCPNAPASSPLVLSVVSSPRPQGQPTQLSLARLWIEFRHAGGGVCSLPAGGSWGCEEKAGTQANWLWLYFCAC